VRIRKLIAGAAIVGASLGAIAGPASAEDGNDWIGYSETQGDIFSCATLPWPPFPAPACVTGDGKWTYVANDSNQADNRCLGVQYIRYNTDGIWRANAILCNGSARVPLPLFGAPGLSIRLCTYFTNGTRDSSIPCSYKIEVTGPNAF
jgi:hypothetical protein